MQRNGGDLPIDLNSMASSHVSMSKAQSNAPLEWDWDIEHDDRKREAKADAALHGAHPFQVDRKVLKDVVKEKMLVDVGRISFLSSGTFHKAYLVTLVDNTELVARVARRFMLRLKTESEVATMQFLRENTLVPVPQVYHYDSNPYNRLGGEYILMSKAVGIPLSKVYHSMAHSELVKLLANLANILVPLFAHRFSHIGSLYFGPDPHQISVSSTAATPRAVQLHYEAFPFSPTLSMSNLTLATPTQQSRAPRKVISGEYHVGPIISWPFFGSNRGDLTHPQEINRGPWSSAESYFASCAEREITGVIRENEGKAAPHRLHLDPDEIHSSRHHHLKAVPGDQSDDSDEWDLEESEEEWEGPGDVMYRDYRRMQRSTFLIAEMSRREECVRYEMGRWTRLMEKLVSVGNVKGIAEFGLDCHDLSLENIFVDDKDVSKITCIIDWESTTIRPLWQCAHLPAFLQSSPFTADLFREALSKVSTQRSENSKNCDLAREWLHYEATGTRLRMAHRFLEWDGWEEGLIDSIIGPEDHQDEWFKDMEDTDVHKAESSSSRRHLVDSASDSDGSGSGVLVAPSFKRRKESSKLPFQKEKEKEQMLSITGDICGGRGGELGRRLEAWLSVNGNEKKPMPNRSWGDDDEDYEAGAE